MRAPARPLRMRAGCFAARCCWQLLCSPARPSARREPPRARPPARCAMRAWPTPARPRSPGAPAASRSCAVRSRARSAAGKAGVHAYPGSPPGSLTTPRPRQRLHTPADLAGAYGYQPGEGGSGQTIGIRRINAYDDPAIEANLKTFDEHYGLGECTRADPGCLSQGRGDGQRSGAAGGGRRRLVAGDLTPGRRGRALGLPQLPHPARRDGQPVL